MGLSENRVEFPNEIAIFHRDNDQQNHWVQWGTLFSDTAIYKIYHVFSRILHFKLVEGPSVR